MKHEQSQGRDNNNGYPHTGAWRLRITHDSGRKMPGRTAEKTLDDSILQLKPIIIPCPVFVPKPLPGWLAKASVSPWWRCSACTEGGTVIEQSFLCSPQY
jgi:hypothetical protein